MRVLLKNRRQQQKKNTASDQQQEQPSSPIANSGSATSETASNSVTTSCTTNLSSSNCTTSTSQSGSSSVVTTSAQQTGSLASALESNSSNTQQEKSGTATAALVEKQKIDSRQIESLTSSSSSSIVTPSIATHYHPTSTTASSINAKTINTATVATHQTFQPSIVTSSQQPAATASSHLDRKRKAQVAFKTNKNTSQTKAKQASSSAINKTASKVSSKDHKAGVETTSKLLHSTNMGQYYNSQQQSNNNEHEEVGNSRATTSSSSSSSSTNQNRFYIKNNIIEEPIPETKSCNGEKNTKRRAKHTNKKNSSSTTSSSSSSSSSSSHRGGKKVETSKRTQPPPPRKESPTATTTTTTAETTSNNRNISEEEVFIAALKKKGLEMVEQDGDGNCLFRAVSLQIYGDSDLHFDIRTRCLDFMAKNEAHFSDFLEGEPFFQYILRKRQNGVHGNNPEIQAISELYNRPVEVFVPDNGATPLNIFHAEYKTSDVPIRLSYHDGNHYNAVIDPILPTAGLGLGLPGLEPGLADRMQIKKAVDESEDLHVKQHEMELKKVIQESKQSSNEFNAMYKKKLLMTDLEETDFELEQAALISSMESHQKKEAGRKQPWNQRRNGGLRTGSPNLNSSIAERSHSISSHRSPPVESLSSNLVASSHVASLPASSTSVSQTTAASAVATRQQDDAGIPAHLMSHNDSSDEYPQTVQELVMNGFPLHRVVKAYDLIGDNFDDLLAFLMNSGDQVAPTS